MSQPIRVRFAPSPTGPLHIGGVRTALYNYLFAKKNQGTFILRIEDTDQNRYVEGAEEYIMQALEWAGMTIDEGVQQGGDFGPYRQSERGEIYKKYANTLIENGWAYKAYDTPEELQSKRDEIENWQYDATTRDTMRNSLTISEEEQKDLESKNTPFVVRFKIPTNQTVEFTDEIRGKVSVETSVLDDKVLFKADGFPTYHMANVIDDHLMEISHVIRGEEWLPSTPLHVLLYKAFGWEAPNFAHLPLILKPEGQGKLSKRDGAKFGFPVFPLNWNDKENQEEWTGYKETGFLPVAFTNFLAFLGWNPGTEQELFSLEELANSFELERVSKAGARFDYDKAKWFNQQHISKQSNEELAQLAKPYFAESGIYINNEQLNDVIELFKERITLVNELPASSAYLFAPVSEYDEKMIRKKWKPEWSEQFENLTKKLSELNNWTAESIETCVKEFMNESGLGFGQVLPTLRLAICGTMQGPSIFHVMALIQQDEVVNRISQALPMFTELKNETK